MLFFFRGPAVRALVGAVLCAIGLLAGGSLLAAIGAVLVVWGLAAAVSVRYGRRATFGTGRRVA